MSTNSATGEKGRPCFAICWDIYLKALIGAYFSDDLNDIDLKNFDDNDDDYIDRPAAMKKKRGRKPNIKVKT